MILLFIVLLLCCVSIINKQAVGKAHPYTIQFMQSTVSIALLPIWFWLAKKVSPNEGIAWNVYPYAILGSLVSTLGFLLFLTAIKTKPVSTITSVMSTYPAILMILCAILGMEKLTIARIIGVLSIVSGVIVIQIFDK